MATGTSTPVAVTAASPAPPAPPVPVNISMKPVVSASASPSPAPLLPSQSSVTSKEWVIPPRPKPGRKPATDTPPTKRKAQNRAAQRAFRERRAARVGELEEHIKKIEDEHEQEELEFRNKFDVLSKQLLECKKDLLWWKGRCQTLESELVKEKCGKEAALKELESATTNYTNNGNQQSEPAVSGGCDNCSPAQCQCIDDAFNLSNVAETVPTQNDLVTKRPNSPRHEASAKRHKSAPQIKPEPEELEIDFTHAFTTRRQEKNQALNRPPPALFDTCGFCQDGTPCICAEMAADQQHRGERQIPESLESNRLAPIQNISQFTPPPSDGDVFTDTLPPIATATKANPCANGPGTCAQCLVDPRSTLFCKSLAASRSNSAAPGCCNGGENASGGGCCGARSSRQHAPPATTTAAASNNDANMNMASSNPTSNPPITLSCSDAFTTLSRHPNFNRATGELNAWLPRLHTLPVPPGMTIANRPAMEVEAASVMGVLRYFDRRFAAD